MSGTEPNPEQPHSSNTAQPSPAPAMAPQPDQQPTEQPTELEHEQEHEQEQEQPQPQPQQDEQRNTELENPLQQHQQPPSPPPFQPLFTLVTDSTTGATHHAHVHYIFSDDEPDLLTDALGQYSTQHQPQTASSSSGSASAKPAPPTTDRAVVLDLVPKPSSTTTTPCSSSTAAAAAAVVPTYEVAWASSLSADWAIVSAKVSPMSADDNDADTTPARGADGALMLRIEGVDHAARPPRRSARSKASLDLSSGSSSGVGQPGQQEDYGAIVDEFEKRMMVLRRVLDAGRERQVKMAADLGAAQSGPGETPGAEGSGHSVSHASVGHKQPEARPSGSRQASNGGDSGQRAGSKRSSGGSGGRAEWEQQPVA